MPLAMHLVVLDDLKGFQAIAARRREIGAPLDLAEHAGPQAGGPDAPAHEKLAVAAAARATAGAAAGPCPEAHRPTAGHALSGALRARAATLLTRLFR